MSFKSGFIALIGKPNVGKSTLLNHLIKHKVTIVSDKAQTTRHMIKGILNTPQYQLVFLDTPGIHTPKDDFGRYLNKTSYGALEGVDVIYFLGDASQPLNKTERKILQDLQRYKEECPVFCLINKIDLISKNELIEVVLKYQAAFPFKHLIPISAQMDDNLETLLQLTLDYCQDNITYFSPDELTDLSTSFMIREIVREKVLYFTQQEIPHSISVQLDKFVEGDDEFEIIASILVNKASHKPIIIGKQGQLIAKIRHLSQKAIKKQFNKQVQIELFVIVEEDWRLKMRKLKDLGYTHD